ncbi:AP2 domain-containing protein [Rhizobium azibense]|nr:AP2 domain-containing protein [Rhizobium azibense]
MTATVDVEPLAPKRKGVSFCPNIGEHGKYRAYYTVNGKNRHLGYYDTEAAALEAVRLKQNMTGKEGSDKNGVYLVQRGKAMLWRATYTPAVGHRLQLGEYGSRGAAILVRDVVARRCGGRVAVADYEMPLAIVSNPIARSYIRDPITQPTVQEIAEYERRVMELSGTERATVPTVTELVQAGHLPKLTLPPEIWRVKQPSRVGRSPFDTLDD